MIGSEEFAYALGAMVCYGLADLVYKRAAMAGVRVPQFLMLQAWFFAPAVLTYALAKNELEFVPAAAWGGAAKVTGGSASSASASMRTTFSPMDLARAVDFMEKEMVANEGGFRHIRQWGRESSGQRGVWE